MILGGTDLTIKFFKFAYLKGIKFCDIILELIFAIQGLWKYEFWFMFAYSTYKDKFVEFIFAGGKFTRFL